MTELSAVQMIGVLFAYSAILVGVTWWISRKTGVEEFIVANRNAHYGWSASTMSATWIWGASIFAAATAGYKYGISGAFHYAFWGGISLIFFFPWAQRIRQIVPFGHTIPEFIFHRHGRASQAVIIGENYITSQYSLILNFTAGASVISLFAPEISFNTALLVLVGVVLAYGMISGIKASLLTDLIQLGAMVIITVVVVPWLFFASGGAAGIAARLSHLTSQQQDPFSLQAFMLQGAPMAILMLAYTFGNPAVWQRAWVSRESVLKRSYISAGLMYTGIVFSVGIFGFIALLHGVHPLNGDLNNLVPQVAMKFLPAALALPLAILLISAVLSTTDSDLSALSSIAMVDVWKGAVNKGASDRQILTVGRLTMIAATAIAAWIASFHISILTLILFYGSVRAALVFPIASSLVSVRATRTGFIGGVLAGAVLGVAANFLAAPVGGGGSFLSHHLWLGIPFVLMCCLGAGTVLGCLSYPFAGQRIAVTLATVAAVVVAWLAFGHLESMLSYKSLVASLSALGGSFAACYGLSQIRAQDFDWATLNQVQPIAEEL